MKRLPNTLTITRMIISVVLVFTVPNSYPFFALYFSAGISDLLDGFLARRLKVSSKFGAKLDSVADIIFMSSVLYLYIPIIRISTELLLWILGILVLRLTSVVYALIKYHELVILHTDMNKLTGFLLFGFPLLFHWFGFVVTRNVISAVATISAVEELLIHRKENKLNRDISSIMRF